MFMRTRTMGVDVLVEFFGHAFAGSVIFMIIGLAGLVVEKFTAGLAALGMSAEALGVLTLMTHVLMVADVAMFAVWIVASTIHALKQILKGR